MTSDTLRAIRALKQVTAQDALDILQALAAMPCSFDTQCLDDCIRILEDCVSDEILQPADFRQDPPSPRGELDAQARYDALPSFLRVAI